MVHGIGSGLLAHVGKLAAVLQVALDEVNLSHLLSNAQDADDEKGAFVSRSSSRLRSLRRPTW